LYAVLLLAQRSAALCQDTPECPHAGSAVLEERRGAVCHPGLGPEPKEGGVGQHWGAA